MYTRKSILVMFSRYLILSLFKNQFVINGDSIYYLDKVYHTHKLSKETF